MLASAVLTGAVVAAGCAGMCRPGWYRPISIDVARLESDRDDLVRLGSDISDQLNHDDSIEFVLDEEQLNRLLVGRAEIWPDAGQWELEGVRDPVIDMLEDGLRIGATTEAGGVRVVVSCVIRVEIDGDVIRLRCGSAGVGALPLPARSLSRILLDRLRRSGVLPAGAIEGGTVVLDNDWVWPNGKRRYRVAAVTFSESNVRVRLEPLR
jgi:hypothetical protein